MREKFNELVKKANGAFKDDKRYNGFWEDGCLFEDGEATFVGGLVTEESDGAGEKYQHYQEVYRYDIDGEEVYLSFTYVGSGSYFSDFYYSGFNLQEVKKVVKIVEIIDYV